MVEIPGDTELDRSDEIVDADRAAEQEEPDQAPQAEAEPVTVIPIKWTKRVRVAKSQGHVGAGIGLLAFGLIGLFSLGHHLLTSAVAVLVAGTYLIIAARELIHIKRGHEDHSRIGWVEVSAGLVVFVEAFERMRPGRIFQPATVMMIPASVIMAFGLLKERMERAFGLKVDDTGFKLRLSPVKARSYAWSEIAGLQASTDGRRLELELKDGRRDAIRLRRVANRDEIREAIASRIPVTPSADPTV